jgi:iron complex transport system permease protein
MKKRGVLTLIILFSFGCLIFAPLVGMQRIGWDALFHPRSGEMSATILWELRIPRVLLAWLAGAALSLGGMAFQALFRNPLATPFTLGVSSGASLGAALCVRLGATSFFLQYTDSWLAGALGLSAISIGAFVGALLAIGLVYGLSQMRRGFSTSTMLLAGVAVNFFFSSLILLIQYTSNFYDTFRILRWLMGGLQTVGMGGVWQALPPALLGIGIVFYYTNELNLLTTGEDMAVSRGVAVGRVKAVLFFGISIMVGGIVAVCGPIGFVGLMCPHICRLLLGPNHRWLTPASLFFGGAFLVVCDTIARAVFAPTELPVGVFTSLLGGPFFLWLLLGGSSEKHLA